MSISDAKEEIDTLIANSRFRCYRPIRVAEILCKSRTDARIDISDPESYRVDSANWRDQVSRRLTGKGSTSSRSYQKDFSNLIRPAHLETLDRINRANDGVVESYIYHRLRNDKWRGLIEAQEYVADATVDDFSFAEYMAFTQESGLEEDSMLEIAVYALFNGIARELDATAKLELQSPDTRVLADFSEFISTFLGLDEGQTTFETAVDVHRAGKGTYAADKGIDIGTNFGTMVQVKHVTLDASKARDIEDNSYVDRIVIVCRDAEEELIRRISGQLGFEKIHGIVTLSQLRAWYTRCFGTYASTIGAEVLLDLRQEFEKEFQSGSWRVPDIDAFLEERGYARSDLDGVWRLDT